MNIETALYKLEIEYRIIIQNLPCDIYNSIDLIKKVIQT